VTDLHVVAHPDAAVTAEFTELASDERIATAAAALERNGIRPLLAATGADARGLVGSLLVDGAEVYNNTSQTLEAIGVADDIERSGRYQPLRLRLYRMDREMQRRELRILAASPDHVVGSVHALTEGGSLLIASASGSQLGPLVSGAGQVILVIGAQKIVGDVAAGMRRIYEYCYPHRGCPGQASLRSAQRGEQHPGHQQGDDSRPDHCDHRQGAPRLLITVGWSPGSLCIRRRCRPAGSA
jgi:hypothetical protein